MYREGRKFKIHWGLNLKTRFLQRNPLWKKISWGFLTQGVQNSRQAEFSLLFVLKFLHTFFTLLSAHMHIFFVPMITLVNSVNTKTQKKTKKINALMIYLP